MLPKFPEFKKLELNDKAVLHSVTALLPPYSDFNFTSLFSWNVNDAGGEKGEGIAGSVADYDLLGGRYCKGTSEVFQSRA